MPPADASDTMTVRVVVVEDEPPARQRLVTMLAEYPDITVVGESEDAASAAEMLAVAKPDLMFLDVQMPEVDGFTLLDHIDPSARPFVIFVTAHAQHALQAFDAGALDYLLKPYDQRRLTKSLDRARAAIRATRAAGRDKSEGNLLAEVRALVDTLRVATPSPATSFLGPRPSGGAVRYLDRVAVTIGPRTIYVPTSAIQWIEADRNYLRLHTSERTYIIRSSVGAFEVRLDPIAFIRVHRSAIVRLDFVRELRTLAPGVWRIVLKDGTAVAVSAPYRNRLPRGVSGRATV